MHSERCTHARTAGWQRRAPNRVGDRARVLVPESIPVQPRAAHVQGPSVAHMTADPNGVEQANAQSVQALERAVAALREQLTVANRRIDELITERRTLLEIVLTDQSRRPGGGGGSGDRGTRNR